MVKGRSELMPHGGKNAKLANAKVEGGPHNGVLTAIEDFLAAADEEIALHVIPRNHGLALLVPATRTAAHPQLEQTIQDAVARDRRPRRPKARAAAAARSGKRAPDVDPLQAECERLRAELRSAEVRIEALRREATALRAERDELRLSRSRR